MKRYGKVTQRGGIELVCCSNDPEEQKRMISIQEAIDNGYKPIIYEDETGDDTDEFDSKTIIWVDCDDCVKNRVTIIHNDPYLIRDRITTLKSQLTATDYKVTKNYETMMANMELEKQGLYLLPYEYDPIELRAERQPLRDQINQLEALL